MRRRGFLGLLALAGLGGLCRQVPEPIAEAAPAPMPSPELCQCVSLVAGERIDPGDAIEVIEVDATARVVRAVRRPFRAWAMAVDGEGHVRTLIR